VCSSDLGIVNSVLEVARLDAGGVTAQRRPWSVRELVDASLKRLQKKTDERGLSVNLTGVDDLDDLNIDQPMLQRVFDELLGNAVEFSPPTSCIDISARREGRAAAVIEVRNTGPHVSPEKLATLTQPFVQGDAGDTRQHEGTGLGLHLVERYVALHDGAVTLESSDDGLFVARICLPNVFVERLASDAAA